MRQTVSVELDDKAIRALHRIEATGVSRSDAIGAALVVASKRLAEVEPHPVTETPGGDGSDHGRLATMADLVERMLASR